MSYEDKRQSEEMTAWHKTYSRPWYVAQTLRFIPLSSLQTQDTTQACISFSALLNFLTSLYNFEAVANIVFYNILENTVMLLVLHMQTSIMWL